MKKKANITAILALVLAGGLYGLVSTSKGAIPQNNAARQAQLEQEMAAIMPPSPVATSTKKNKAKTTLMASTTSKASTSSLKSKIQTPLGQNYMVVDLGDLGGGVSRAWDINSSGQVVGFSVAASGTYLAFLYSKGVMQDLGTFGGDGSSAMGINDLGQIVGFVGDANAPRGSRPFLYTNGGMHNLPVSDQGSGWTLATATAINNSGQITGMRLLNGQAVSDGYLMDNDSITDIGSAPITSATSHVPRMNAAGHIVAYRLGIKTSGAGTYVHGFIYANGITTDIGSLMGGETASRAYGINNSDEVVGTAMASENVMHAFLYSDGAMQDIDTLNSSSSVAYGINSSGQVVGAFTPTGTSTSHAFVYSGGQMQDLNSLVIQQGSGWTLSQANAINDAGEIVGNGINPDGKEHAFKLKPLPVGSIQAVTNEPAKPVFSTPFAKLPGKDSLIVITHGWNPSWQEPDNAWVNTMSNALVVQLANTAKTNWQVNGYLWPNLAHTLKPETAFANAIMEGNNIGRTIATQQWSHVHFISHSAGAGLIERASEVVRSNSTVTSIHCTFLDMFLPTDRAGVTNYGRCADWSDSYYCHDKATELFGRTTEGCLSNAFNVDVTQLDVAHQSKPEVKFHSSSSLELDPCKITKSVHHWPVDFYLNTITGSGLTIDYSVCGFPMSLEGGGLWQVKLDFSVGNVPAVVLGTPDTVCYTIESDPPLNPSLAVDYTTRPKLESTTGTVNKGNGWLELRTGSPAWVLTVVDTTNTLNKVSFDAQFSSAQGAQGLLSVYWDTEIIGSLSEEMIEPGTARYTFTFPDAGADTAHALSFRLDPFTNIQSVVVISNITLGVDGPTEPFTLSVTTNRFAGLPWFKLNGQAGFDYGVQMSTNLAGTNWTYIATLVNTNGTVNFYDPDTNSSAARFYRAVWVK